MPLVAVGRGDIGASGADIGGVVIVQPAEIDARGPVQGALADQIESAAESDAPGRLGHLLARRGVQDDDVVEPATAGHLIGESAVAGRRHSIGD